MRHTIVPYAENQRDAVCAIMRTPGIIEHFASQGTPDEQLADPNCDQAAGAIAVVNGRPCGASIVILVPAEPPWAMVRLGVLPEMRRRGIGTALLHAVARHYEHEPAERRPCELRLAAVTPSAPAESFARMHGFTEARCFLHMRWGPEQDAGYVTWPAGVVVRTFGGGERALADWTAIYNASFGEHWGWVPATIDEARSIARESHFRDEGLALAYRDGECVGFCRLAVREREVEIATLGVSPSERRAGLGRALLRWGIAAAGAHTQSVTLIVDAENRAAVSLYREEGFLTQATRVVWSRRLEDVRPGPHA